MAEGAEREGAVPALGVGELNLGGEERGNEGLDGERDDAEPRGDGDALAPP